MFEGLASDLRSTKPKFEDYKKILADSKKLWEEHGNSDRNLKIEFRDLRGGLITEEMLDKEGFDVSLLWDQKDQLLGLDARS